MTGECYVCGAAVTAQLDKGGGIKWVDANGDSMAPAPDLPDDPYAVLVALSKKIVARQATDAEVKSYSALSIRVDSMGTWHVHRVASRGFADDTVTA